MQQHQLPEEREFNRKKLGKGIAMLYRYGCTIIQVL